MSTERGASRSPDGVGQRVPLIDAASKVTGSAVYTDDLRMPGMLVGKILRSHLPHARIVSIDTSRAEAMPGVKAVVTGKRDMAKFGVLPISKDEVALAVDRVKYVGDCVAGVAADSEETALAALDAIDVVYEPLRVFSKAEESLEEIDPGLKINPDTRHKSNLHKQVDQNFGDVDGAIASAAHVASGKFRFVGVTHAFTEPHCVIAHYEPTAA